MLEKQIQQKIVAICKQHGIVAFKCDSTSSRGWPDLTIIMPDGTVHFVEVKTERGVVSALQKRMHDKLRNNNANVHVIRSVEEFTEFVDRRTASRDYRAV
jgi:Holliday junction resolvase-like predicted endonuclease